jgi:hypothetical protein
MTANKVATYQDLEREYVRKFGEKPNITGIDWCQDPTELLVEAIDSNVPINQRPVPTGLVS